MYTLAGFDLTTGYVETIPLDHSARAISNIFSAKFVMTNV
jgi:hypothetical protein